MELVQLEWEAEQGKSPRVADVWLFWLMGVIPSQQAEVEDISDMEEKATKGI